MTDYRKTKKYAQNYERIRALVWDSFCNMDLFLQNAANLYGVDGMIKKIYLCKTDADIRALVFSII